MNLPKHWLFEVIVAVTIIIGILSYVIFVPMYIQYKLNILDLNETVILGMQIHDNVVVFDVKVPSQFFLPLTINMPNIKAVALYEDSEWMTVEMNDINFNIKNCRIIGNATILDTNNNNAMELLMQNGWKTSLRIEAIVKIHYFIPWYTLSVYKIIDIPDIEPDVLSIYNSMPNYIFTPESHLEMQHMSNLSTIIGDLYHPIPEFDFKNYKIIHQNTTHLQLDIELAFINPFLFQLNLALVSFDFVVLDQLLFHMDIPDIKLTGNSILLHLNFHFIDMIKVHDIISTVISNMLSNVYNSMKISNLYISAKVANHNVDLTVPIGKWLKAMNLNDIFHINIFNYLQFNVHDSNNQFNMDFNFHIPFIFKLLSTPFPYLVEFEISTILKHQGFITTRMSNISFIMNSRLLHVTGNAIIVFHEHSAAQSNAALFTKVFHSPTTFYISRIQLTPTLPSSDLIKRSRHLSWHSLFHSSTIPVTLLFDLNDILSILLLDFDINSVNFIVEVIDDQFQIKFKSHFVFPINVSLTNFSTCFVISTTTKGYTNFIDVCLNDLNIADSILTSGTISASSYDFNYISALVTSVVNCNDCYFNLHDISFGHSDNLIHTFNKSNIKFPYALIKRHLDSIFNKVISMAYEVGIIFIDASIKDTDHGPGDDVNTLLSGFVQFLVSHPFNVIIKPFQFGLVVKLDSDTILSVKFNAYLNKDKFTFKSEYVITLNHPTEPSSHKNGISINSFNINNVSHDINLNLPPLSTIYPLILPIITRIIDIPTISPIINTVSISNTTRGINMKLTITSNYYPFNINLHDIQFTSELNNNQFMHCHLHSITLKHDVFQLDLDMNVINNNDFNAVIDDLAYEKQSTNTVSVSNLVFHQLKQFRFISVDVTNHYLAISGIYHINIQNSALNWINTLKLKLNNLSVSNANELIIGQMSMSMDIFSILSSSTVIPSIYVKLQGITIKIDGILIKCDILYSNNIIIVDYMSKGTADNNNININKYMNLSNGNESNALEDVVISAGYFNIDRLFNININTLSSFIVNTATPFIDQFSVYVIQLLHGKTTIQLPFGSLILSNVQINQNDGFINNKVNIDYSGNILVDIDIKYSGCIQHLCYNGHFILDSSSSNLETDLVQGLKGRSDAIPANGGKTTTMLQVHSKNRNQVFNMESLVIDGYISDLHFLLDLSVFNLLYNTLFNTLIGISEELLQLDTAPSISFNAKNKMAISTSLLNATCSSISINISDSTITINPSMRIVSAYNFIALFNLVNVNLPNFANLNVHGIRATGNDVAIGYIEISDSDKSLSTISAPPITVNANTLINSLYHNLHDQVYDFIRGLFDSFTINANNFKVIFNGVHSSVNFSMNGLSLNIQIQSFNVLDDLIVDLIVDSSFDVEINGVLGFIVTYNNENIEVSVSATTTKAISLRVRIKSHYIPIITSLISDLINGNLSVANLSAIKINDIDIPINIDVPNSIIYSIYNQLIDIINSVIVDVYVGYEDVRIDMRTPTGSNSTMCTITSVSIMDNVIKFTASTEMQIKIDIDSDIVLRLVDTDTDIDIPVHLHLYSTSKPSVVVVECTVQSTNVDGRILTLINNLVAKVLLKDEVANTADVTLKSFKYKNLEIVDINIMDYMNRIAINSRVIDVEMINDLYNSIHTLLADIQGAEINRNIENRVISIYNRIYSYMQSATSIFNINTVTRINNKDGLNLKIDLASDYTFIRMQQKIQVVMSGYICDIEIADIADKRTHTSSKTNIALKCNSIISSISTISTSMLNVDLGNKLDILMDYITSVCYRIMDYVKNRIYELIEYLRVIMVHYTSMNESTMYLKAPINIEIDYATVVQIDSGIQLKLDLQAAQGDIIAARYAVVGLQDAVNKINVVDGNVRLDDIKGVGVGGFMFGSGVLERINSILNLLLDDLNSHTLDRDIIEDYIKYYLVSIDCGFSHDHASVAMEINNKYNVIMTLEMVMETEGMTISTMTAINATRIYNKVTVQDGGGLINHFNRFLYDKDDQMEMLDINIIVLDNNINIRWDINYYVQKLKQNNKEDRTFGLTDVAVVPAVYGFKASVEGYINMITMPINIKMDKMTVDIYYDNVHVIDLVCTELVGNNTGFSVEMEIRVRLDEFFTRWDMALGRLLKWEDIAQGADFRAAMIYTESKQLDWFSSGVFKFQDIVMYDPMTVVMRPTGIQQVKLSVMFNNPGPLRITLGNVQLQLVNGNDTMVDIYSTEQVLLTNVDYKNGENKMVMKINTGNVLDVTRGLASGVMGKWRFKGNVTDEGGNGVQWMNDVLEHSPKVMMHHLMGILQKAMKMVKIR
eukprot:NODE_240_length_13260_cov_0.403313.p1 type:complete len:2307 gc:universal NODE_240_length_13260_cov_0.403313:319-7239(+)